MTSLTPISDSLRDPAPNAIAQRIATQAANYSRALAAGNEHDPSEIRSMLKEVQGLLVALEAAVTVDPRDNLAYSRQRPTAEQITHTIALQAGNYARSIGAGVPHDVREVGAILADLRRLLSLLGELPGERP